MDLPDRCNTRIVFPSARAMYAAAERWRDEALIDDRSLFGGHPIDPQVAIQDLRRFFIENEDIGTGTFVAKLTTQLAQASSAAVQVAAELLYAHLLIASTTAMSSDTKSKLIEAVLAIRDQTTPMTGELRDALRGGAAHPGTAFQTLRWKMLRYLIEFFAAVKALDRAARIRAFSTPDDFAQLLSTLDDTSVLVQRFALEHLLFPDRHPRVVSRDDRAEIKKTFAEADEDLPQIFARLTPNAWYADHAEVDLYRSPYRDQWRGRSEALTAYGQWAKLVTEVVDLDEEERSYKIDGGKRIHAAMTAVIADPSQAGALIHELRTAVNLVDYRVLNATAAWVADQPQVFSSALTELMARPGPESIDRFLALVPQENELAGMGARLSLASTLLMSLDPQRWPPWRDRAAGATRRLADGYAGQESATAGELYVLFLERLQAIRAALGDEGIHLRDDLDTQGLAWTIASGVTAPSWSQETQRAFDEWHAGKSKSGPPAPAEAFPAQIPEDDEAQVPEQTIEDLAEELSIRPDELPWLEETIELLRDKRQLIFQGPPGTGKTFMAKAIARFFSGATERVRLVQFHPGYSYEDFVAGLRPDPANPTHFTVVDGPLLRIAEEARSSPDQNFVLIIDELNRGNVPAVFGELYFLLEYRDEEMSLMYGGEPFALPRNLFIIATMNTADRSITALDSALRRRFYVRDLVPGETPLDGILERYLSTHRPELRWLSTVLVLANAQIADRDQAIGPSHFMRPDISEVHARRAWENTVMPTLRELFWSRQDRLDELGFDLLMGKATGTSADTAPD